MRYWKALAFAIVIAAVVASFLVFPLLPKTVPIHWNAAGNPDGFGAPWFAAFLIPLAMAGVLLLFVLIPKIAVFKKNLKAFEAQYWLLGIVIEAFFAFFYAVTLLPNFGFSDNMGFLFTLPLGFMFIAIGILLPSFKRNFFVGIRTPWTLSSDRVWKKTHEFGGKAFIISGVATLAAAFIPGHSIIIAVVFLLAAAIATIVYSYMEFRKTGKK